MQRSPNSHSKITSCTILNCSSIIVTTTANHHSQKPGLKCGSLFKAKKAREDCSQALCKHRPCPFRVQPPLTQCRDCFGILAPCRRKGKCFCPRRSRTPGGNCSWAFSSPQPVWSPGCGCCPGRRSWTGRDPSGNRGPRDNPPPAAPALGTTSCHLHTHTKVGHGEKETPSTHENPDHTGFFVPLQSRRVTFPKKRVRAISFSKYIP